MSLNKITDKWCDELQYLFEKHGKAVIAIDPEATSSTDRSAAWLREQMAIVVEEAFNNADIREMFIEGGSTAAAVIKRLGLKTFIPVEELAPGVVRMQVKNEDLFITVKPGSYPWPERVWKMNKDE